MYQQFSDKQRAGLRSAMRKRRRGLSYWQQQREAIELTKKLKHHRLFRDSQHIAFYLANDGELNLQPLLHFALGQGKICYLPAVADHSLVFIRHLPEQKLERNRFGILQPQQDQQLVSPEKLDLVLLPLVAFDQQGNRLGMGGGFYDRYFAYKRERAESKPLLLGVAHPHQEVPHLRAQIWDVPLDAIMTGREIIYCSA